MGPHIERDTAESALQLGRHGRQDRPTESGRMGEHQRRAGATEVIDGNFDAIRGYDDLRRLHRRRGIEALIFDLEHRVDVSGPGFRADRTAPQSGGKSITPAGGAGDD